MTTHGGGFVLVRRAVLLGLAAGLASCESSGPRTEGSPQPPPTPVVGAQWVLVALEGEPLEIEEPPTLVLASDGSASGFAGVNTFRGPYEHREQRPGMGALSFGTLATTRMAGPPEETEIENHYLEHLGRVDHYRAAGGLLELSSQGMPLLRYRRTSKPE